MSTISTFDQHLARFLPPQARAVYHTLTERRYTIADVVTALDIPRENAKALVRMLVSPAEDAAPRARQKFSLHQILAIALLHEVANAFTLKLRPLAALYPQLNPDEVPSEIWWGVRCFEDDEIAAAGFSDEDQSRNANHVLSQLCPLAGILCSPLEEAWYIFVSPPHATGEIPSCGIRPSSLLASDTLQRFRYGIPSLAYEAHLSSTASGPIRRAYEMLQAHDLPDLPMETEFPPAALEVLAENALPLADSELKLIQTIRDFDTSGITVKSERGMIRNIKYAKRHGARKVRVSDLYADPNTKSVRGLPDSKTREVRWYIQELCHEFRDSSEAGGPRAH